jgi:hypothetical protein
VTGRLSLAGLIVTLACQGGDTTGPGRLEVEWTGADTGQLQLPALARWCRNDSLVVITGASGDSGVALAVLPEDTAVTSGVFQVGLPLAVFSRPAARVALRWPGEALTEGYYGLSGTITIDSGSALSGSLQATLKSVNDGREISMSGVFRELRIQEGSPESCGIAPMGSPVRRMP